MGNQSKPWVTYQLLGSLALATSGWKKEKQLVEGWGREFTSSGSSIWPASGGVRCGVKGPPLDLCVPLFIRPSAWTSGAFSCPSSRTGTHVKSREVTPGTLLWLKSFSGCYTDSQYTWSSPSLWGDQFSLAFTWGNKVPPILWRSSIRPLSELWTYPQDLRSSIPESIRNQKMELISHSLPDLKSCQEVPTDKKMEHCTHF